MNQYFQIGIISIPAYSLFACIGAFAGMIVIYNRVIGDKDFTFTKFLLLIGFIAGGVAIGSKALFVITIIPDIIKNWSISYAIKKIITAGFVFYGGLFGAIIGIFVFSKLYSISFDKLKNITCPAFPLFHSIGRIGCLFAGCCYGNSVSNGWYHLESEPNVSRIPIQLYESIFLCFLTLLVFFVDKRFKERKLFPIYLLFYSVWRFIIEFYRGDELRGIWGPFSTSQWISIIIFTHIISVYCSKHKKKAF